MSELNISTYHEVTPLIYSWTTDDVPKYAGWEKIGYTEQDSAEVRIGQQASQMSIEKKTRWVRRALYTSESGGRFTDRDFHAFLKQQSVERELTPKRTEWHRFDNAAKTSLEYFNAFAGGDFSTSGGTDTEDYSLRPEQHAAVDLALAAFGDGHGEVLWNAKPRFGKTLTTYDLIRRLDVRRALIVTNRPAIANSWFDDFERFIGHQTHYVFVSESSSLESRTPMTRQQWLSHSKAHLDDDPRLIEFVSLQDLKGSRYFGGSIDKLRHVAEFGWDLLVIDEAHEGIDTSKTDVAFDQIDRKRTLHLSGTPFKALAAGKFGADQIFNWSYEDEQEARARYDDAAEDNPYASLPRLNMLTYQVSRMITDQLAQGVAIDEDAANIDFTFDLNEFFSTKDNGFFQYEPEVLKFLDTLAQNEKYPFSTPELRDEIRHSFWMLSRVASAKALERILKQHEVFKDYTVILAAGDGRTEDDSDSVAAGKALEKVRSAISEAEKVGGKTITLSVGQLTTGVTVPEWTAVIMLSDLASPQLYMQAAFRAQNPCTFERAGVVFQKKNAYIFDFAPERTLTIFDKFANNLRPNPSGSAVVRQDNIRTLLNFFPVIGEDSEGRMIELDASQVLTFPQTFKAREVVRRGFLSNLLFANVGGIFRHSEHLKEILDKLPTAAQGKVKVGQTVDLPVPAPTVDQHGKVIVDVEAVINPKIAELGKPVWRVEEIPPVEPDAPAQASAKKIALAVTAQLQQTRESLKDAYGLSAKQTETDQKRTEQMVTTRVERAYIDHGIAQHHLDDELKDAATEAEAAQIEVRKADLAAALQADIMSIVSTSIDAVVPDVVAREETKKEQRRADTAMDDARSHLRGFARTIPMFLMAYGEEGIRLSNFDDYTPDQVFEEITGITEEEFRLLRDGREVVEADGTITTIPGLFDEAVFDQSIQEFLAKKAALSDYFDESQTEDIFAYIPQQKTSLVFTPQPVVRQMVDALEMENPGIFSDPDKTFIDPFSTAGLFVMELVRRLDRGLAVHIPDQAERLKHILETQVFEMSHNAILHEITLTAVSGGVAERRSWIEESGHFRVGNIAKMSPAELNEIVEDMLEQGAGHE